MRTLERIRPVSGWGVFLLLFAAVAAGITSVAQGATSYYVDAQNGNDAWSGTQAEPSVQDGPWRSLRRIGAAALEAGDTVNLKCDNVWRETLTLIRSGAQDRPIVVQPYGEDCSSDDLPTIDAAVPLTGWRHVMAHIYAAKVDFDVTDLYVDGQYLPPARYPRTAWLRARQSPAATAQTIHDPGLMSLRTRGLAGAELRVRSQDWLIEARQVDRLDDNGGLVLKKNTEFPIRPGVGYYLLGLPWMLSYPGAWVYDSGAGEVLIWLSDDTSPDTHLVEAPRYGSALAIGSASYIDVEKLRLRHSRLTGVAVLNSHNINLRGLSVLDSGQNGIDVENSQAIKVSDSTVKRSQWNGIMAAKSTGITVSGNRVVDSNMVGSPSRSPAAINMGQASWVVVEANTITNSGYTGIRFKRHARVINNTIIDSCQVLNDCGAIYAWADNDPSPGLDSEVTGNKINGTRASDADSPYPSYASGIYLDDLTNGVSVTGNTVTNADSGVHIHNGFNLVVEANTLKNNRRNQIYLSMGHPRVPGAQLSNNRFSENTLEYDGTRLGVQIQTRYPEGRHAEFNNDHYVATDNRAVAYESPRPGMEGNQIPELFSLDRWRSEKHQELQGTFTARQADSSASYRVVVLDSDYSRGLQGWNAWSPDGAGRLYWRPACAGSGSGCLELDPKSKLVLAISKPMRIAPGRSCELRVRVRSDALDNPVQIRLRRSVPPFASAGLSTQSLARNVWDNLVFRFNTSKDWKGDSQIELKATAGRVVQLDELRLLCR